MEPAYRITRAEESKIMDKKYEAPEATVISTVDLKTDIISSSLEAIETEEHIFKW